MGMTNVLLIDDDEGDLILMKDGLRKKIGTLKIATAASGEEGLDKIDALKPVLVVSDTQLQGMDGFATCEKIKERFQDDVKVIICTGVVDAVDAGRAREAGADGYCVKTSDFESLVAEVKRFV